jgi:hypothetical protein
VGQIKRLCTERQADPNKIAHNKFIVLPRYNKPVAVRTGFTNFTEGGIFGHSNVGHVVGDAGALPLQDAAMNRRTPRRQGTFL